MPFDITREDLDKYKAAIRGWEVQLGRRLSEDELIDIFRQTFPEKATEQQAQKGTKIPLLADSTFTPSDFHPSIEQYRSTQPQKEDIAEPEEFKPTELERASVDLAVMRTANNLIINSDEPWNKIKSVWLLDKWLEDVTPNEWAKLNKERELAEVRRTVAGTPARVLEIMASAVASGFYTLGGSIYNTLAQAGGAVSYATQMTLEGLTGATAPDWQEHPGYQVLRDITKTEMEAAHWFRERTEQNLGGLNGYEAFLYDTTSEVPSVLFAALAGSYLANSAFAAAPTAQMALRAEAARVPALAKSLTSLGGTMVQSPLVGFAIQYPTFMAMLPFGMTAFGKYEYAAEKMGAKPLDANLYALNMAMLEMASEAPVFGHYFKLMGNNLLHNPIFQKGWSNVVKTIGLAKAVTMAKAMLAEGAQEAFIEPLDKIMQNWYVEKQRELITWKWTGDDSIFDVEDILKAYAGGMLMAAMVGGAGSLNKTTRDRAMEFWKEEVPITPESYESFKQLVKESFKNEYVPINEQKRKAIRTKLLEELTDISRDPEKIQFASMFLGISQEIQNLQEEDAAAAQEFNVMWDEIHDRLIDNFGKSEVYIQGMFERLETWDEIVDFLNNLREGVNPYEIIPDGGESKWIKYKIPELEKIRVDYKVKLSKAKDAKTQRYLQKELADITEALGTLREVERLVTTGRPKGTVVSDEVVINSWLTGSGAPISRTEKMALLQLGYTAEDIEKLTPEQLNIILKGKGIRPGPIGLEGRAYLPSTIKSMKGDYKYQLQKHLVDMVANLARQGYDKQEITHVLRMRKKDFYYSEKIMNNIIERGLEKAKKLAQIRERLEEVPPKQEPIKMKHRFEIFKEEPVEMRGRKRKYPGMYHVPAAEDVLKKLHTLSEEDVTLLLYLGSLSKDEAQFEKKLDRHYQREFILATTIPPLNSYELAVRKSEKTINTLKKVFGTVKNFLTEAYKAHPRYYKTWKVITDKRLPASLRWMLNNIDKEIEGYSAFSGQIPQHMAESFISEMTELHDYYRAGASNLEVKQLTDLGPSVKGGYLVIRPHGTISATITDKNFVNLMYLPRDASLPLGELSAFGNHLLQAAVDGEKIASSVSSPSWDGITKLFKEWEPAAKQANKHILALKDTYKNPDPTVPYIPKHVLYIWDEARLQKEALEPYGIKGITGREWLWFADRVIFQKPQVKATEEGTHSSIVYYRQGEEVPAHVWNKIFFGSRKQQNYFVKYRKPDWAVNWGEEGNPQRVKQEVWVGDTDPTSAINATFQYEDFIKKNYPKLAYQLMPMDWVQAAGEIGAMLHLGAEMQPTQLDLQIRHLENKIINVDAGASALLVSKEYRHTLEKLAELYGFNKEQYVKALQSTLKNMSYMPLHKAVVAFPVLANVLSGKAADSDVPTILTNVERLFREVEAMTKPVDVGIDRDKAHISKLAKDAIMFTHFYDSGELSWLLENLNKEIAENKSEGRDATVRAKETIRKYILEYKDWVKDMVAEERLSKKGKRWVLGRQTAPYKITQEDLDRINKWTGKKYKLSDFRKLPHKTQHELHTKLQKLVTGWAWAVRNKKATNELEAALKKRMERYVAEAQKKLEGTDIYLYAGLPFGRETIEGFKEALQGLGGFAKGILNTFKDFGFFRQFKSNEDRNDIRLFINKLMETRNYSVFISQYIFGGLEKNELKNFTEVAWYRNILSRMDNPEKKFKYRFTKQDVQAKLAEAESRLTPETRRALERFKEIDDIFRYNMISRGDMKCEGLDWHIHIDVEKYDNFVDTHTGLPVGALRKKIRSYVKESRGTISKIWQEKDDGTPHTDRVVDTIIESFHRVLLDQISDDFLRYELEKYDKTEDLTSEQRKGLFKNGRYGRPGQIIENPFGDGIDYRCYLYDTKSLVAPLEVFRANSEGELYKQQLKAMFGTRRTYMIPTDIYDAFLKFNPFTYTSAPFLRQINQFTSLWKQSAILSSYFAFNVNNMLGDTFITYLQYPHAISRLDYGVDFTLRRTNHKFDTYDTYDNETERFVARQGVLEAGLVGGELAPYVEYTNLAFPRVWNKLRKITYLREGFLRVAVARSLMDDYKHRVGKELGMGYDEINEADIETIIKKAQGDPNVKAVGDKFIRRFSWIVTKDLNHYDALGKIARDMMVDYAAKSRLYNMWVRGMAAPFLTWYLEASKILGKYLTKKPHLAFGRMVLPLVAMSAMNYIGFPEEEYELPSWVRNAFHLILTHPDEYNRVWVWRPQIPTDVLIGLPLLNIAVNYAFRAGVKRKDPRTGRMISEMSWEEAATRCLRDFGVREATSARFLVGAMIDFLYGMAKNQNKFGKQIYNPNYSPWKQLPDVKEWFITCMLPPVSVFLRAEKSIKYGATPQPVRTVFQYANFPEFLGFYQVNLTGTQEELQQENRMAKSDEAEIIDKFQEKWLEAKPAEHQGIMQEHMQMAARKKLDPDVIGKEMMRIIENPWFQQQKITYALQHAFEFNLSKADQHQLRLALVDLQRYGTIRMVEGVEGTAREFRMYDALQRRMAHHKRLSKKESNILNQILGR